jgi:hypothetical protein
MAGFRHHVIAWMWRPEGSGPGRRSAVGLVVHHAIAGCLPLGPARRFARAGPSAGRPLSVAADSDDGSEVDLDAIDAARYSYGWIRPRKPP